MVFKVEIEAQIMRLRGSPAYQHYLDVRAHVFRMMDGWRDSPEGGPSAYWQEEIDGFSYLFDASPLIIDRFREQCYHITGIKSYEYRSHHSHKVAPFENKYKRLAEVDPVGLFVPEAPEQGGFGFDFGKGLVNVDTLKFYEVLIGLEKSGVLSRFRGEARHSIMEIGSGWGGFAYQFKQKISNATYICVDLPPTMLFSGFYLKCLFPDAAFLFYGEEDFDNKIKNLEAFDFVFLPHYYFPDFKPEKAPTAINMVSFQEMTTGQVEGYVRGLRDLGCQAIYSMNRDRSKHNSELSTVSEVLSKYYPINEIHVIDAQYTDMKSKKGERPPPTIFDYRHFLAGN